MATASTASPPAVCSPHSAFLGVMRPRGAVFTSPSRPHRRQLQAPPALSVSEQSFREMSRDCKCKLLPQGP